MPLRRKRVVCFQFQQNCHILWVLTGELFFWTLLQNFNLDPVLIYGCSIVEELITNLIIIWTFTSYSLQSRNRLIHEKNIQSLSIKLFKFNRIFSNVIRCNIFKTRTLTYNSWSEADFATDCVTEFTKLFHSKGLGCGSFRNEECKSSSKIETQIQKCPPENCSCYICRPYIQNLIFLDLVYIFNLFI